MAYRRQDLDTGSVDSNDEWRSRCIRNGVDVEQRVVGRDKQTNDEDAPDIKEQDTKVNFLDRLRDGPTGIPRFSSCYLVTGQAREKRGLVRKRTATASVPTYANMAWVATLQVPRNWPFAPGP